MWNLPPRQILVATDFGDAAAQAARIAGELARAFDASITAVHAESFEAPPYFTREQVDAIEHQRRNARRGAAQYLARTVARLAGVDVRPVVTDAPAVDAILSAAAGHDLIVLGTHGRRGAARWWAGSVAEQVARHATIPVLVVRTDTASASALFSTIRLVADAESDPDVRAYADGLGGPFGGQTTAAAEPTLAVVAQSATHAALAGAQALKACHVPVLIVPTA
jgi:nucleotide-binding universal stress UspA family protein